MTFCEAESLRAIRESVRNEVMGTGIDDHLADLTAASARTETSWSKNFREPTPTMRYSQFSPQKGV